MPTDLQKCINNIKKSPLCKYSESDFLEKKKNESVRILSEKNLLTLDKVKHEMNINNYWKKYFLEKVLIGCNFNQTKFKVKSNSKIDEEYNLKTIKEWNNDKIDFIFLPLSIIQDSENKLNTSNKITKNTFLEFRKSIMKTPKEWDEYGIHNMKICSWFDFYKNSEKQKIIPGTKISIIKFVELRIHTSVIPMKKNITLSQILSI
tara:strand:+ start:2150 stop:2764 length:615 start_codon:yes stop_codon:yes gene_type:complete